MVKTAGRVLKSNDVKLEGQFHLDMIQAGSHGPKPHAAVLSAPKVRVLENHPQYAVIEVTCSCGSKISIKCDYAATAEHAPDGSQA